MGLSVRKEVARFVQDNRQRYNIFLTEVRRCCEEAKRELGHDIIRAVYSRAEKQGDNEFKTEEKIALALSRLREDRAQAQVKDVTDIVGLTVIVYYHDNIALVTRDLKERLKGLATVIKDGYVDKDGYHGHHVVFRSKKPQTIDAHCEVQIKTMLHDAWSAKTHDLNYKPRGFTDGRLARMMQVFGASLQAIEVQSEVLRDLIHERWNAELQWRRIVRQQLFNSLPTTTKRTAFSDVAKEIYAEIQAQEAALATVDADSGEIETLLHRINELCSHSPRESWWLAMFLAVVCPQAPLVEFATSKLEEFLHSAKKQVAEKAADLEDVWSTPLTLYACGEIDRAIRTSENLLEEAEWLDDRSKAVTAVNLANFLVERAYFGPPRKPEEVTKLRGRIEALIRQAKPLEDEDPTAFHDLRGMLEVALSDDPSAVRDAIDLIYLGNQDVPAGENEIAKAYFELHIRLAWRRLLELEGRRGA